MAAAAAFAAGADVRFGVTVTGVQRTRGRITGIVGRDGSVQLPAELTELLPPGSLLRAEHLPDGVVLRRVDQLPDTDGPRPAGPVELRVEPGAPQLTDEQLYGRHHQPDES